MHDSLGGIEVHSGWNNTVSGNFLVNNTGAALQNQVSNALGAGAQAAAGNVFNGNLVSTAGASTQASVNLGTTANAQWSNNFYDSTTLGNWVFGTQTSSGTYQADTLSLWKSLGYDTGATVADPQLVGYVPASGSPALAAGIANLPLGQMRLSGFTATNPYDSGWGMT